MLTFLLPALASVIVSSSGQTAVPGRAAIRTVSFQSAALDEERPVLIRVPDATTRVRCDIPSSISRMPSLRSGRSSPSPITWRGQAVRRRSSSSGFPTSCGEGAAPEQRTQLYDKALDLEPSNARASTMAAALEDHP